MLITALEFFHSGRGDFILILGMMESSMDLLAIPMSVLEGFINLLFMSTLFKVTLLRCIHFTLFLFLFPLLKK